MDSPSGEKGKEAGSAISLSLRMGDVRRPESREPSSWTSTGLAAGLLPCPSTGVEAALPFCSLETAPTGGPPTMKPKPL